MNILYVSFLVLASVANGIDYGLVGKKATKSDIPYHVLLYCDEGESYRYCGGALLSDKLIITAARCIDIAQPKDITAYIGSTQFIKGLERIAQKKTVHSGYNRTTFRNDIGLVLIESVTYSYAIAFVALPDLTSSDDEYSYTADSVNASGFGLTPSIKLDNPLSLYYAELLVIGKNDCIKKLSRGERKSEAEYIDSSRVICAATPNTIHICRMDNGGPLVDKETKVLIGIATDRSKIESQKACIDDTVATFTRITKYRKWLKRHGGF